MAKYSVSHTELMDSVWYVVKAVNALKQWYITYPFDHKTQKEIVHNFKAKSSVGFDVCAGAIDGILTWIHKPMVEEAKCVGIDQQRFYCRRKHKFGLNCQAVFDAHSRFLDISITYEGASSDLLSFKNSICSNISSQVLWPRVMCYSVTMLI